jgi:hypothetical protein
MPNPPFGFGVFESTPKVNSTVWPTIIDDVAGVIEVVPARASPAGTAANIASTKSRNTRIDGNPM